MIQFKIGDATIELFVNDFASNARKSCVRTARHSVGKGFAESCSSNGSLICCVMIISNFGRISRRFYDTSHDQRGRCERDSAARADVARQTRLK